MKEMPIMTKVQHETKTRNLLIIGILSMLIVLVFIISMNTGYIKLSPLEVIRTLFGLGTDKQQLILFEFRLPVLLFPYWWEWGLRYQVVCYKVSPVMLWPIPEYWGLTQELG